MKIAKPLQVQAYESLKKMILDGELSPDTIYSETKASQELGVSRTPLRDAIHRLAQEGYIDVIPSKGFRLHHMTEKDLVETAQIRSALEGYCAVQLAERYETSEAQRVFHAMESLLRDQDAIASTTGDAEEFTRYDTEFHQRLVYSLNNSVISETFDALHYQLKQQTYLSLLVEGRMKQTVAEHKEMLDNMKNGHVRGSYLATLTHIGKAQHLINLD